MRTQFRFVHVEHLVDRKVPDPTIIGDRSGFSALSGRLTYRELIPVQPLDPDTSCLLGLGEYGEEVARQWRQACTGSVFLPSGGLELRDMVVLGRFGLLLDIDHQMALVGGTMNLNVPLGCDSVSTSPPEYRPVISEDRQSFEIDLPDVIPVEPRPGLLMMAPGQDVYGHWLLDYAPRLMLAGLMHGSGISRYYFNAVPNWAFPLLACFGVPGSAVEVGPRPQFVRYPLAAKPSGTKEGFRVSQPISRMAWLRLKHMLLEMPITDEEQARLPGATRIFVSRNGLRNVRVMRNAERLEEMALRRGFVPVRPEEFSLPAQALIFRDARVVLGEDGSGLHNIMFGEPGCILGVVTSRINLWHMAICQQLGHFLCNMQVGDDGVTEADEAEYDDMIDLVLGAAAQR